MAARALVALLALAVVWPAAAQWRGWEADFDEETKAWTEIQARIPAYPKPENLIPFEVAAASAHRYYIDAASLTVGEDGVVRYTLLLRTAGGATNVSFEGIRCETREQKFYANGRPDGSWTRARDPKWRNIEPTQVSPHHRVLFRDFFCNSRFLLPTAKQIADALRRESWHIR
jgi:hypothetical protein